MVAGTKEIGKSGKVAYTFLTAESEFCIAVIVCLDGCYLGDSLLIEVCCCTCVYGTSSRFRADHTSISRNGLEISRLVSELLFRFDCAI